MGPEEAMVIANSPPVEFQKRKVITSVGPDGQVPQTVEAVRLTPAGRVVDRLEGIFVDELGVAGDPAQLRGRCQACRRVSFAGQVCAECGMYCCPECGQVYEESGQTRFLCKRHLRAAKFHRDLWGTPEPRNTPPPSPDA